MKQLLTMFPTAFPDFRAVVHDQVSESDKVVTRKTLYGPTRAALRNPADGQGSGIELINILRLSDGKITEHWNVVDQFGLMQQIGAIDG